MANVKNVTTNAANEIPHPMYVMKLKANFASGGIDSSSLFTSSKIAKCVK